MFEALVYLSAVIALAYVATLVVRQRRPSATRADLRAAIDAYDGRPLADAGPASVLAVASALALHPDDVPPPMADAPARREAARRSAERDVAWQTRQLIRPLGLELLEVIQVRESSRGALAVSGQTVIQGLRHGRLVSVYLRETSSEIRVELEADPFRVGATGGIWTGLDAAAPSLRDALEGLAPSRRWEGLVVEGGSDGITLQRADAPARSWMHDLWLAELVARAAPCPAVAAATSAVATPA